MSLAFIQTQWKINRGCRERVMSQRMRLTVPSKVGKNTRYWIFQNTYWELDMGSSCKCKMCFWQRIFSDVALNGIIKITRCLIFLDEIWSHMYESVLYVYTVLYVCVLRKAITFEATWNSSFLHSYIWYKVI